LGEEKGRNRVRKSGEVYGVKVLKTIMKDNTLRYVQKKTK
jgi:hypothetical protein